VIGGHGPSRSRSSIRLRSSSNASSRTSGEPSSPCGNCDNCLQAPATWDATEAARKALSCVYRFHQHTLIALKELVQAAGLTHPSDITARHIVRRTGEQEVKLLANLLPFLEPGALLAAIRGEADWPHNVYRIYWNQARSDSFALVRGAGPAGRMGAST